MDETPRTSSVWPQRKKPEEFRHVNKNEWRRRRLLTFDISGRRGRRRTQNLRPQVFVDMMLQEQQLLSQSKYIMWVVFMGFFCFVCALLCLCGFLLLIRYTDEADLTTRPVVDCSQNRLKIKGAKMAAVRWTARTPINFRIHQPATYVCCCLFGQ